jgi:hypothetical protein
MELRKFSIELKEWLQPGQVPENATPSTVHQAMRSQSILQSDIRGRTHVLVMYAKALIQPHVYWHEPHQHSLLNWK